MRIRQAHVEDAGAIATVRVQGWRHAYRGLLPDDVLDGMSVEDDVRWRRELLARPPQGWRCLVADVRGNLIGFVTLGPTRDLDAAVPTGEIGALYVLPEAVGTGVGRALMAAAVEAMRGLAFEQATLWVLEGNDRARRFYRAAGWLEDGARKDGPEARFPAPEVRFRIRLGEAAS